MPGQLGPISRVVRMVALQRVVDAQLVVRGDALGDRDHQLDSSRGRLEDRIGGEPRGHEDHRGVRLGALGRLCPRVEDGNALHVLAALAGRHAADHVRAVAPVVERVERALAAGDPGDRQAGVLVDEDAHQLCLLRQRDDLLGRLVHRARRVHVRQCGLLQQLAPRHIVRAVQPDDEWHRRFDLVEGRDQTFRNLVAAGDAAEDVEQHGLDRVVGEDQLDGLLDLGSVRAAARVEEVCRPPACLRDHVECATSRARRRCRGCRCRRRA